MAGAPGAIVLDACAALQDVIPDSKRQQERAPQLLTQIHAGQVIAHVPVIFFNEVAVGCARAVKG